jgi:hypothetical protein
MTGFLTIETREHLQALVDEQLPESLTLDYKASPALSKEDRKRDEMCKDVSAFANSAGGQIVYGIEEDGPIPVSLDKGSDPNVITREWIEQVLNSRISPKIEGLRITPIPLGTGNAFVITVPQATSRAPHQAPDNKYYRRYNFQSVAMADYEVRDMMRRTTTPDLVINLSFATGENSQLDYAPHTEISRPVSVIVSVSNKSPQPAFHTVIRFGIHTGLQITENPDYDYTGTEGTGTSAKSWLVRRHTTPPDLPIFEGLEQQMPPLYLRFSSRTVDGLRRWPITAHIQSPGCNNLANWVIQQQGSHLRMLHPDHPLLR